MPSLPKRLGLATLGVLSILALTVVTSSRADFWGEAKIFPVAQAATVILGRQDIFNSATYTTWPSSTVERLDAPWSPAFMPVLTSVGSNNAQELPTRQFLDLNGDGLLDYVYSSHTSVSFTPANGNTYKYIAMKDLVMLNTGAGWTTAYKCVAEIVTPSYELRYYGDCAQQ